MFPVYAEHLRAAGASASDADRYIAPLVAAMSQFQITTRERPAMFVAQVASESGSFRYTSELWGPTPTQLRYEGRGDLGNTQPGDGSRFRGHGLIQVTGRANHEQVAAKFGITMEQIVDWLKAPLGAALSAAFFWQSHGCNEIADTYDFVALTRRINGGLNGLDDRISRYNAVNAVK